jgi:hypothetical protein
MNEGLAMLGHSVLISDFLVAFNSASVCLAPDAISRHLAARAVPRLITLSISSGFSMDALPRSLPPLLNLYLDHRHLF